MTRLLGALLRWYRDQFVCVRRAVDLSPFSSGWGTWLSSEYGPIRGCVMCPPVECLLGGALVQDGFLSAAKTQQATKVSR